MTTPFEDQDDDQDDFDSSAYGLNNDSSQPIRRVVNGTLLVCKHGGIAFSTDYDKIKSIHDRIKDKIKVHQISVTSHVERITQVANNCITKKLPDEARKNPIAYRNSIIRKWQDYKDELACKIRLDEKDAWERMCKKLNVPVCTYEEFNQWLLDYNEYVFSRI
jgi:hypothetical protein